MLSPTVKWFLHLGESCACFEHPYPKVKVLCPASLVPASDTIEHVVTDERGPVRELAFEPATVGQVIGIVARDPGRAGE